MFSTVSSALDRLSLSTKVAAMILVALVALATATAMTTLHAMNADALKRAAELQETHMGVAWEVMGKYGDHFRVDGDTLYAGNQPLNGFNAPVDRIQALVGGTATLFRGDMRVATNVRKDDGSRAVGKPLAPGPAYDAVLKDGVPYRGRADILGKDYFTAYDPIKNAQGKVIGVLYVGILADQIVASMDQVRTRILLASALIVLVAGGVCLGLARRMFRPLEGIRHALVGLAGGDHASAVPGLDRADEIGGMAGAVDVLRQSMIAKQATDAAKARADAEQAIVVDTVSVHLAELSNGNLTTTITTQFPPEYAVLKSNFNEALAKLRELIGSVADRAAAIRTGSGEIAEASEDLARRTESNAASLEQTAASITQIDGRLRASAGAASRTVEHADQAIATVDGGRAVADEAVQAMDRVSDSAKGIDGVIEGLDKIAFQTRVLAMNAAVEAGRAGEAGNGFAVVADLVSALAMRAEEEAQRARNQLTATQADIVTAVEAVQRVDGALTDISGNVAQVHDLLATMAADNQAQSAAITEISSAIGTMDRATQQNAAMVEQTSAAARNLAAEVTGLTEQAARFNVAQSGGPIAPPPAAAPAARPARVLVDADDGWM